MTGPRRDGDGDDDVLYQPERRFAAAAAAAALVVGQLNYGRFFLPGSGVVERAFAPFCSFVFFPRIGFLLALSQME